MPYAHGSHLPRRLEPRGSTVTARLAPPPNEVCRCPPNTAGSVAFRQNRRGTPRASATIAVRRPGDSTPRAPTSMPELHRGGCAATRTPTHVRQRRPHVGRLAEQRHPSSVRPCTDSTECTTLGVQPDDRPVRAHERARQHAVHRFGRQRLHDGGLRGGPVRPDPRDRRPARRTATNAPRTWRATRRRACATTRRSPTARRAPTATATPAPRRAARWASASRPT